MSVLDTAFRIAELEDRAAQQTLAMVCSPMSLLDLRDHYMGGHSAGVAEYCRDIGLYYGLPQEDLDVVVMAASLHDIGKIGVPDRVLLKEGKLDDEEFEWIRKHPEWGWAAIRNVNDFRDASLLMLHHHERWDGSGYPGNLRGTDIPLGSRIITVADSFDALTTNRPYRTARTTEFAVNEIVRCAGTQFDEEVVR